MTKLSLTVCELIFVLKHNDVVTVPCDEEIGPDDAISACPGVQIFWSKHQKDICKSSNYIKEYQSWGFHFLIINCDICELFLNMTRCQKQLYYLKKLKL